MRQEKWLSVVVIAPGAPRGVEQVAPDYRESKLDLHTHPSRNAAPDEQLELETVMGMQQEPLNR
jgi:hypothetical protein